MLDVIQKAHPKNEWAEKMYDAVIELLKDVTSVREQTRKATDDRLKQIMAFTYRCEADLVSLVTSDMTAPPGPE